MEEFSFTTARRLFVLALARPTFAPSTFTPTPRSAPWSVRCRASAARRTRRSRGRVNIVGILWSPVWCWRKCRRLFTLVDFRAPPSRDNSRWTHIVYVTEYRYSDAIGVAYLAATGLPLLMSSQRTVVVLGAIVLAGLVVAYALYWEAFVSIWCFFAAAASVTILCHFEWVAPAPPATRRCLSCLHAPGTDRLQSNPRESIWPRSKTRRPRRKYLAERLT